MKKMLTDDDIRYAIKLLVAALNYVPKGVDKDEDGVLRWESEGGRLDD